MICNRIFQCISSRPWTRSSLRLWTKPLQNAQSADNFRHANCTATGHKSKYLDCGMAGFSKFLETSNCGHWVKCRPWSEFTRSFKPRPEKKFSRNQTVIAWRNERLQVIEADAPAKLSQWVSSSAQYPLGHRRKSIRLPACGKSS